MKKEEEDDDDEVAEEEEEDEEKPLGWGGVGWLETQKSRFQRNSFLGFFRTHSFQLSWLLLLLLFGR